MLKIQCVGVTHCRQGAQRVPLGHGHAQVVMPVSAGVQQAGFSGIPANADRGHAFADATHHLGADAFFEIDLDVLVLRHFQELGNLVGQRFGHDRGGRQEVDPALNACCVAGHVALDAAGAQQHAAGVLQQGFASRRGHHAVPTSGQQARAHGGLQLGQPFADSRSHHIGFFGGTAHVAGVANRHKQTQRSQVEVSHQAIPYRNK